MREFDEVGEAVVLLDGMVAICCRSAGSIEGKSAMYISERGRG
jgi:hypothetical protein